MSKKYHSAAVDIKLFLNLVKALDIPTHSFEIIFNNSKCWISFRLNFNLEH